MILTLYEVLKHDHSAWCVFKTLTSYTEVTVILDSFPLIYFAVWKMHLS